MGVAKREVRPFLVQPERSKSKNANDHFIGRVWARNRPFFERLRRLVADAVANVLGQVSQRRNPPENGFEKSS